MFFNQTDDRIGSFTGLNSGDQSFSNVQTRANIEYKFLFKLKYKLYIIETTENLNSEKLEKYDTLNGCNKDIKIEILIRESVNQLKKNFYT